MIHNKLHDRQAPWKTILNPPLVLGVLIILILILVIWMGPIFASYDPYITSRLAPAHFVKETMSLKSPPFPPGKEYPLGSDIYGNDLLTLLLYGSRTTLISVFFITAAKMILGVVLGGLAGWMPGSPFDRLVSRVGEVLSSTPMLLSAMVMILALGITNGRWVFILSLAALGWTEVAQIVRGELIRIRKMPYVDAAIALGNSPAQILIRHVVPNTLSYLLILSCMEMGTTLFLLAELGFLRIFIGGGNKYLNDPNGQLEIILNYPEWGGMIAQGLDYIRSYPYIITVPAIGFTFSIVGFNALSEGLRRVFDRWPISTEFVLKKGFWLLLGGLAAVTALIFRMTSPEVSYQQAAETFSLDRVLDTYLDLASLDQREETTETDLILEYMTDYFEDHGVSKGWAQEINKHYTYPVSTTLVFPEGEPILIVDRDLKFSFPGDFFYKTEGCAGKGSVQAPGVFLNFPNFFDPQIFQNRNLQGKVVLIREEQVRHDDWKELIRLGAEGVLVIKNDSRLTSHYEVSPSAGVMDCPSKRIPVFEISQAAAQRIFARAGFDWGEIKTVLEGPNSVSELNIPITMELNLKPPELTRVPNAIGFIGGFDIKKAAQIVVVYISYDGLGIQDDDNESGPDEEDLLKIATLLEIIHSWEQVIMDPRRSVHFVIWGGEGAEDVTDRMIRKLLFTNKLAAKVETNFPITSHNNPVKPAIWIEIDDLNFHPETISLTTWSAPQLQAVVEKASQEVDLPVEYQQASGSGDTRGLPGALIRTDCDSASGADQQLDNLESTGTALNRIVIQLVRDVDDGL